MNKLKYCLVILVSFLLFQQTIIYASGFINQSVLFSHLDRLTKHNTCSIFEAKHNLIQQGIIVLEKAELENEKDETQDVYHLTDIFYQVFFNKYSSCDYKLNDILFYKTSYTPLYIFIRNIRI